MATIRCQPGSYTQVISTVNSRSELDRKFRWKWAHQLSSFPTIIIAFVKHVEYHWTRLASLVCCIPSPPMKYSWECWTRTCAINIHARFNSGRGFIYILSGHLLQKNGTEPENLCSKQSRWNSECVQITLVLRSQWMIATKSQSSKMSYLPQALFERISIQQPILWLVCRSGLSTGSIGCVIVWPIHGECWQQLVSIFTKAAACIHSDHRKQYGGTSTPNRYWSRPLVLIDSWFPLLTISAWLLQWPFRFCVLGFVDRFNIRGDHFATF